MNEIDLSNLSAEALDKLIVDAGEKRAAMHPALPRESPRDNVRAFENPAWYCAMTETGTLLQILHPGYGWLSFHLPPQDRVQLMSTLLNQCLISGPPKDYKPDAITVPQGPLGSGGSGRLN